ncbi:MAG TPA: hypothetical protein VLL25_14840 [Acidimicrobiales bacterium]|nr:hypothetical protein [Acidimicrobiales bacterium]
MIYLSGAVKDELLELNHPRIGAMFQPRSYGMATVDRWPIFAADSGGYNNRFQPTTWLRFVDKIAMRGERCLFACVPDHFDPHDLDHNFERTQYLWFQWKDAVIDRGLPPAWVAQNGATPDDIPADADAVFIAGDTEWKLSERAWAIVAAAKARSRWVHMGRVNGLPRFRAGAISCVDSADGNVLKYGYHANLPRLLMWLNATETPHLSLFGRSA